ncbi:MAG TPA: hypothetical protein VK919_11475 [Solirubrobacterales bacterium]|nr:hypothetical protein [Solirubrobacterales bacterium]
MTAVATRLNRRVRLAFDRDDAVRLGYLVGAVEAGAADTGGIHEDLVLRLNSAAGFAGDGGSLGARFERGFGEGHAAGRERGLATSH